MQLGLEDRVIVVTGAAAGIGAATARSLTDEGAFVIGVDRCEAKMAASSDRLTPVIADLTDAGTPALVVEAALDAHGRIDGLVNNAGAVNLRTRVPRHHRRGLGGDLRPEPSCTASPDPSGAAGDDRRRERQPRPRDQRSGQAP